ncbi:hypothetical protein [Bradyrhizobium sp. McL0616]|uniref:hypothetical protein n=1 Tax=Bradyrhizobium sp. McL0616 TaxID=3415674 RepID=UPI003CEC6ED6
MLDPTLCSVCRSLARFSRAWSGVVKIVVTTNPVNKALDKTDPIGFLNVVIVAIPFDWVIPREA